MISRLQQSREYKAQEVLSSFLCRQIDHDIAENPHRLFGYQPDDSCVGLQGAQSPEEMKLTEESLTDKKAGPFLNPALIDFGSFFCFLPNPHGKWPIVSQRIASPDSSIPDWETEQLDNLGKTR